MNVYQIKLLAISLMILDHIGAYLLPDYSWLRVIGRLSFPLFAWLIANGYRHTSNTNRYLWRLLIFAIISQIPFALAGDFIRNPLDDLNIFFTLWIGLASIALFNKCTNLPIKIICLCVGMLAGWILPVDYGAAGVLSIIAFHLSFKNLRIMFWSQLLIFGITFSLPLVLDIIQYPNLQIHPVRAWQPIAALSVIVIALYNHQKGPSLRYIFYAFYPVHLLIIYALQLIL